MTHQPQLTESSHQSSVRPHPDNRLSGSRSDAAATMSKRWKPSLWVIGINLLTLILAQAAGAQTVIDGLPPPPSIPELEPQSPAPSNEPAAGSPAAEPAVGSTAVEEPAAVEPVDVVPTAPADSAQRYRVLINSDSPFLLEQVRRVEPAAAFERYQGQSVILAGQFAQLAPAQQQVEALADQGIGAEIAVGLEESGREATGPEVTGPEVTGPEVAEESEVAEAIDEPFTAIGATATVAAAPTAPDDEFDQLGSSIGSGVAALPPAELSAPLTPEPTITDPALAPEAVAPAPVAQSPAPQDAIGSDYYIVVPGDADSLNRLQGQVALLGANPNAIAQRDQPLGPHLLIGPFVNRQSATRWNQFLRDFGMDSRVYYRR